MRLASMRASASGLPSSATISAAIVVGPLGEQPRRLAEHVGALRRGRAPPAGEPVDGGGDGGGDVVGGATPAPSTRPGACRPGCGARTWRRRTRRPRSPPIRLRTRWSRRPVRATARQIAQDRLGPAAASCPTWRSRAVLPRCSSTAVMPAWQQAMSSLVCPPRHADAADHLAVDLDRPAADEDREPALVHVHDAERLLAGLGVGVGVRRAAVAGGGERLVDGDLDAGRLAVVGPLDGDRPAGGVAHARRPSRRRARRPWPARRRRRARPPRARGGGT